MAKKKVGPKEWSTGEMEGMLSKTYGTREGYMTLWEVSDRTPDPLRRCDAMAISLWGGRNQISGFEIKSSRADWLNELKDPCKAEVFKKYCDYWYLVAPEHIVKDGELPKGWGHLIPSPRGAGLVTRVQPELNKRPKQIPREFLVVLIRNGFQSSERERHALVQAENTRAEKYWRKHFEHDIQHSERRLEELREVIKIFEGFAGIQIKTFSVDGMKNIGQLLYRLMNEPGYIQESVDRMKATRQSMDSYSKALDEIINQLDGDK